MNDRETVAQRRQREQMRADARTFFIGIFFVLVALIGVAWAIVAALEGRL